MSNVIEIANFRKKPAEQREWMRRRFDDAKDVDVLREDRK